MKRNTLLAMLMTVSLGMTVSVAFAANADIQVKDAPETACIHSGNHYNALLPTSATGGTKEYWVCCTCHEHYLTVPTGTWSDAGTASSVESTDDRYWAYDDKDAMITYLQAIGFESASIKSGQIVPGQYTGSSTTLIIPEGVSRLSRTLFQKCDKDTIEWIVIPSGCFIEESAFSKQTKCSIYFVDNRDTGNWSRKTGIYKIQGTGWDYVNGVPTAK